LPLLGNLNNALNAFLSNDAAAKAGFMQDKDQNMSIADVYSVIGTN
jgi:hypothetical protein